MEPTIDQLIPHIHSTFLSQGGDEACDAAEAVNADRTTSTAGQVPGHGDTGEAITGTRHVVDVVVKGAGPDMAEGVRRRGGSSEGDAGGGGGKATSGTTGQAIKVALDTDGTICQQGVPSDVLLSASRACHQMHCNRPATLRPKWRGAQPAVRGVPSPWPEWRRRWGGVQHHRPASMLP